MVPRVSLSGSCLCGAVRVELSGEPYRVGICHCLDCRKKSGSIFSSWAIYPAEAVDVTGATAGHELRGGYVRHVCPACTSPIYEVYDGSDEIEVFVGLLDEPNRLTPTYETWTVRREAWLPELPLARHYERNRGGSGRTEP
jgi:hypothetical protein